MSRSTARTAARIALAPLTLPYAAAVAMRNAYYDHVRSAGRRAALRVISVGNITAGGSGKTPLVIEIVRRLIDAGRRPAILTRGYDAPPGRPADEVQEFAVALPGVPVVVDANRTRGAGAARTEHAADCVVLDDGFQHRRLCRDVDIVLIDALNAWGGGMLLPAGRLREPLRGLRRADAIVISRSNQVAPELLVALEEQVRRRAPQARLLRATVEPHQLIGFDGGTLRCNEVRDWKLLPVCGIGNPATFVNLLESLSRYTAAPLVFPDHHRYSERNAHRILAAAVAAKAQAIVTTRKDWVKLRDLTPVGPGRPPMYWLDIQTRVLDERGEFSALLVGSAIEVPVAR